MITIGNEVYELKYTVRALFVYEQITGLPFAPDKLINEYTLMYAILLANNERFNLVFDEFIALCDNDQNIFLNFRIWLLDVLKQKVLFQNAQSEEGNKKKD